MNPAQMHRMVKCKVADMQKITNRSCLNNGKEKTNESLVLCGGGGHKL